MTLSRLTGIAGLCTLLAAGCVSQWTGADQSLLDGLKAKDSAKVENALVQGAKPNIEYADGMSPLAVAVARNDHASARALLHAGANPNAVVELGAAGGKDAAAARKASLLSLAEDSEMARILVEGGADPNRKDPSGESPLGRAVLDGDAGLVQALLAVGANVESPLAGGQSPLSFAVSTGNLAVTRELLAGGADPNREDADGRTALHDAAANPNGAMMLLLLEGKGKADYRSHDGTTPLMVAAADGYIGPTRILLESGADPNIKNNIGMTALDIANAKGQAQIAALLEESGGKPTLDVAEARSRMRSAAGGDALRVLTSSLTSDGRYMKIRGRVENPYSETVRGVRYRVSVFLGDSKRVLDSFREERDDTEIPPGGSAALRLDVATMYAGGTVWFVVDAMPMRLGEREIPEPPQW